MKALFISLVAISSSFGQDYDLILRGGHVIDAKNNIDAVRDVAIRGGKIAAVAARVDGAAKKTVDVTGLYVTPGLIDIHTHVYAGTGERGSYAGDNSVYPDGFTFRSGVTTIVDAGSSGWRNFPDFQERIINRSRTRVFALLNIVGSGMRGGKFENDMNDMDSEATAKMALSNKDVVVGVKCAHYAGPEWTPVERAVKAGTIANVPVMIDFGTNYPDRRPLQQLLTEKLRPGDIYTHMYSGNRNELTEDGKPNPGMIAAKKRGVILDVGHGGGSFLFRVAVPLTKAGIWPDSISTDLHITSMNAGMKDMLNVMSKMLVLGMPLKDVITASTWNPAREIHHEELGNLSVGSAADVAVLRVVQGDFGFADHLGARMRGKQKFVAELTLRDGIVRYDLNAITSTDWEKLPANYKAPTQ